MYCYNRGLIIPFDFELNEWTGGNGGGGGGSGRKMIIILIIN